MGQRWKKFEFPGGIRRARSRKRWQARNERSCCSDALLCLTFFHVADAVASDGHGIRGIIENLNGHPALVPAILEGLKDGHEIGVAEAGAAAVAVVGMEMARTPNVSANQFRSGRLIGAHRLHIEV